MRQNLAEALGFSFVPEPRFLLLRHNVSLWWLTRCKRWPAAFGKAGGTRGRRLGVGIHIKRPDQRTAGQLRGIFFKGHPTRPGEQRVGWLNLGRKISIMRVVQQYTRIRFSPLLHAIDSLSARYSNSPVYASRIHNYCVVRTCDGSFLLSPPTIRECRGWRYMFDAGDRT